MRIYIDEAGPFVVPPSAQSLFSLVLALVIPSSLEDPLFAEFSALRDGWSNQGAEVNGSKLDESRAAHTHSFYLSIYVLHSVALPKDGES